MDIKEQVLKVMKEAGKPVSAGEVEKTSEKGIPFASVRWNYGRRTDYHCGRS